MGSASIDLRDAFRRHKKGWVVFLGLGLAYGTGMIGGPHVGKVVNSLTQEPIEGAEVRVYFDGIVPGPGHASSQTLKTIDTTTNKSGWYYTWPWIGPPKGLFVGRYTYPTASKAGFVPTRGRYRVRTHPLFLVPEAEVVMEQIRDWWWAAENATLLDPTFTNPNNPSEFNDNVYRYEQYLHAYDRAKQVAKTARELEFLAEMCDRTRKFYESITWTARRLERLKECGDRCSYAKFKEACEVLKEPQRVDADKQTKLSRLHRSSRYPPRAAPGEKIDQVPLPEPSSSRVTGEVQGVFAF